jgi:hypothetical protein
MPNQEQSAKDKDNAREEVTNVRIEQQETEQASTSSKKETEKKKKKDTTGEDSSDEFLDRLTNYLDSKFDRFKRELVEEQSEASAKLVKKIKTTRTFAKKSNKVQHELNVDIKGRLEESKDNLLKGTPNVQKAVNALDEGIELLDRRNKLIILADSSEAGWKTVEEYEQRNVASDSEDDKRIRRAESTAIRKLDRQKRGRSRGRFSASQGRGYTQNHGQQYGAGHVSGSTYGGFGGYGNQSFRGHGGFQQRKGAYNQNETCHGCGKPGHWHRNCPAAGPAFSASTGNN